LANDTGDSGGRPPDWRPIPDPTVLTTEAIRRDIDHLRELFDSRYVGLEADFESFTSHHDREHREIVERAIQHLKELTDEKFRGIALQFAERDVRTEQAFTASTEAITAAMAAQEKAIGKSEVAVAKQIDDLRTTFVTALEGTNAKVDDVKDRVVRAEGSLTGEEKKTAGISQATGLAIAAAGVLIGFGGVVVAVIP
jgi:Fe2+ transport system protein B